MSKDLIKKLKEPIPVDPNMKDFSDDPYVVAKTEKAREFLLKNGIPKSDINKSKAIKKTQRVKPS
jgi:hypothetical protein